jgi:hypothetical protein
MTSDPLALAVLAVGLFVVVSAALTRDQVRRAASSEVAGSAGDVRVLQRAPWALRAVPVATVAVLAILFLAWFESGYGLRAAHAAALLGLWMTASVAGLGAFLLRTSPAGVRFGAAG